MNINMIYNVNIDKIKAMALEFRLSSKNLCRLLGYKYNTKNEELVVKKILDSSKNEEERLRLIYLFYETNCENDRESLVAYDACKLFLLKVQKANITQDTKLQEKTARLLYSTEFDFQRVKEKIENDELLRGVSQDDALILAKYRIKYCLSKMEMAKICGLNRDTISKYESRLESKRIKNKLENLKHFKEDISKDRYRHSSKVKKRG